MNTEAKIDYAARLTELGISVRAEFVPFSVSRNAKPTKQPARRDLSLNWRVTLVYQGRDILTTDYSAGIAHGRAYKASRAALGSPDCILRYDAIRSECETGLYYLDIGRGPKIEPEAASVVWSLIVDSDVLNTGGFEDWAANYGYDTDSRKAEGIYRACLDIALKLRAGIGESTLAQLRELFQDY